MVMGLISQFINSQILLTLCCSFSLHGVVSSLDTITSSYILKAPETLSSNDGMFHLEFFTPTNSSTFSYLGIWYITKPPFVWVANRDQPIKDTSSSSSSSSEVLKIFKDGNLVLMNAEDQILWSTNVSNISSNTTAKLLNSGNLVLQENATGRILWQSFQHPTNAFLQGMELSTGNERKKLSSWRSPEDPSIGEFSLSLERLNIPEVIIWRGSQPHWRSGPWNGKKFLGIPGMQTNYLNRFYLSGGEGEKDNSTYYIAYNFANQTMVAIYMLVVDGNLYELFWDHAETEWLTTSECDVYGKCGVFGSCDPTSSPICNCLRGYEPKNAEEWNIQNWTSGCVRKKPLQCESEGVRNEGRWVCEDAECQGSSLDRVVICYRP